jgi:hypothetical protein
MKSRSFDSFAAYNAANFAQDDKSHCFAQG